MSPFSGQVADAAAAHAVGPEYVRAVGKVVASHVRNELAGAAVFDEPAIALAPGPTDPTAEHFEVLSDPGFE